MRKKRALLLLGGNMQNAADLIGCTIQAIYQWPDPLTDRISDRVTAALERKNKSIEKAQKKRARK